MPERRCENPLRCYLRPLVRFLWPLPAGGLESEPEQSSVDPRGGGVKRLGGRWILWSALDLCILVEKGFEDWLLATGVGP